MLVCVATRFPVARLLLAAFMKKKALIVFVGMLFILAAFALYSSGACFLATS
jgi:hypothetical protein